MFDVRAGRAPSRTATPMTNTVTARSNDRPERARAFGAFERVEPRPGAHLVLEAAHRAASSCARAHRRGSRSAAIFRPGSNVQSASVPRWTPRRGCSPAMSSDGNEDDADRQHERRTADEPQQPADLRARREDGVADERVQRRRRRAAGPPVAASQAMTTVATQRQRDCLWIGCSLKEPSQLSCSGTYHAVMRQRFPISAPSFPRAAARARASAGAGSRGSPVGRCGSRAPGCRRALRRSDGSARGRFRSRRAWS